MANGFKSYRAGYHHGSSMLSFNVIFHDNLPSSEFFLYVDKGESEGADYLVKCRPSSFEVLKATQPGLYNDLKYSGTPVAPGAKSYFLEIPKNALGLGYGFSFEFWFFEMSLQDRMPDSGTATCHMSHYDMLISSVEEWNQWRVENPDANLDFSSADLREALTVGTRGLY